MTTIVVVDDHKIVREGLRKLLEARGDFHVIGEASDGEQAVEIVLATKPDVVVMDIWMPRMSGVEATRKIRRSGVDTKVLINRDIVPLLIARRRPIGDCHPVTQLENVGVTLLAEEFTQKAVERHGSKKMLNFEMGRRAIQFAIPTFSVEHFDECFQELTSHV